MFLKGSLDSLCTYRFFVACFVAFPSRCNPKHRRHQRHKRHLRHQPHQPHHLRLFHLRHQRHRPGVVPQQPSSLALNCQKMLSKYPWIDVSIFKKPPQIPLQRGIIYSGMHWCRLNVVNMVPILSGRKAYGSEWKRTLINCWQKKDPNMRSTLRWRKAWSHERIFGCMMFFPPKLYYPGEYRDCIKTWVYPTYFLKRGL